MTISGDPSPVRAKASSGISANQAEDERIAQEYEEEAAMGGGPADPEQLVIRVRKLEERLAAIEDYLGGPPSKETLEDRLEKLETSN